MNEDTARQTLERGRRAKLALDEFVAPAIAGMRDTYHARMGEIIAREPWEVEKIKALVSAIRLVDTIEQIVSLQVKDGEAARHDLSKVENINSMTHARRRALGL